MNLPLIALAVVCLAAVAFCIKYIVLIVKMQHSVGRVQRAVARGETPQLPTHLGNTRFIWHGHGHR